MSGIFACCFCFPPDPVDDDPRKGYANKWQIDMGHSPAEEPLWCLYGMLCPCCATYQMRKRALGGSLANYQCCQGYFTFCCISPGNMGESSCPECCLCLEACCCLSCAVSATRFYIMDQYNIVSDPCDNRIIRFNNCMQLLSCVLDLLSICISELRDAAQIVDIIAKCVYLMTIGCMTAQQHRELSWREQQGQAPQGGRAPPEMEMTRDVPPQYAQQGQQQQAYAQQGAQIPMAQAMPVADAKPVSHY